MLQINNLKFGYPKNAHLFDSLDLEITKGNIYGLLGRNGAGKSTLLKIMCGLLYSHEGQVQYSGTDISKRQPRILEDIFLIPEEFPIPDFTVEEYVTNVSPFYPKFNHMELSDLIEELEVVRGKKLQNLSYGQKKKFMIAFAIATNCSYVFMDEPTNGLDIPSKSKFRKLIASATNDDRVFIISTHQVRDLENLIDPVVIIESGKIIFNHTIETIANKLNFIKTTDEVSDEAKVLYSEPVFGGHYVLTNRTDERETPIDFELLFNAVLSEQKVIVEHLKN